MKRTVTKGVGRRHAAVILGIALAWWWAVPLIQAQFAPQNPPGPPYLVVPPTSVWGKEYTDMPNINAAGNAAPGQSLWWNGAGGVANSILYPTMLITNVDAVANQRDALYSEITNNMAPLVISVTGDSGLNSIWYEDQVGITGVWATKAQINAVGVTDLDGLEMWGPLPDGPGNDDSDRVSLFGDLAGVSVYHYNPGLNTLTPYITRLQIATAISAPGLENQIDLDALMTYDDGDDYFGGTDSIMFSIRPAGPFDGGEVWVWDAANPVAGFLNHGGHQWNTAFNVMGAFGVANENVDALEGVPEPGSCALLGAGLALLLGCRHRSPRRPAV